MQFKYNVHEKVMTWNEDKDLKPITYRLPDPPPLDLIEGYGLPPQDQFWVTKPMPPKLAKINALTHAEDGKTELTPRMKMLMLEKNPDFYHDEILWIEREWERRENGFWFFNNGTPTAITGDHYFYLQYWPIDGVMPDFRNRDRRWFWFWHMVDNDDNCFGFNNPKQRREGATIKVCSIRRNRASMYRNFRTGLQSKDESSAEDVHYNELVETARSIPFYFQPISDNAQNVWKEIRFSSPRSKTSPDYGYAGLNSNIDFKDAGPKAYDGTKQWLIHNDEIGKLNSELDVNERVRIQIPCLTNIVRNSSKKGKMINTSTTGEMEGGGGRRFKDLCDASDYHKRNDNGLTMSGLYTLFQSAKEGMEGIDPRTGEPFIDKYGNANAEAIERYLIAKRESLRKAKRIADYIEECRQYPLEYVDCWKASARQCVFNLLILEERIEYYRNGNPDKIRGNFEWSNGFGSKVRFLPSDNGRWYVSLQLDPSKANRMIIDENGVRSPNGNMRFVAGGDPYKFSKTKYKGSYGGGAVFYKYDHAIDAGKTDTNKWESCRFVCTYKYRPNSLEEYGTDMIMMCQYYNAQMFPEVNVDFLYKYFIDQQYGGYLHYIFDPNKGKYASTPGQYTHVKEKEQIFTITQSYIERHGMRERHDELLKEWKGVVDELTDFDLAVAAGLALIAAGDIAADDYVEDDSIPDISHYYQRYKY